jgi:hypothetical protein
MIPIKDMVESPHPINKRYSPYWDFLLMSYEGGIDYSNSMLINSNQQQGIMDSIFKYFVNGVQQNTQTVYGNLFMHPKERVEDYNRRVNMSYYYNFCAPIIDIYGDHLFKQGVNADYEELEDSIALVGEDIDNQGSSISEFRKSVSDMAQILGHIFVIVDSPNVQANIRTRKDQIDNRAFPYFTTHLPQNVINWSLDSFGNANWVLIREIYDSNEDPLLYNKNKREKCLYRLWTRDEWYLYSDDYNPIEQGFHGLGEVPIVCVFDKKSKKCRNFLGVSSISDISFIVGI